MAERLEALVRRGRVAHAYLFAGPAGVGKRQAALSFAKRCLCGCGSCTDCAALDRGEHLHLTILAPSEGRVAITIEQVRSLIASLLLRPQRPLPRFVVIDPADAMVEESMNTLLKMLEEPPEGVTFVLITTSAESLLPTLRSRCHLVRFYPASTDALRRFVRESGTLSESDVELIASLAAGSFGEATRLKNDIESIRTFVSELDRAVKASDLGLIVDTLLKAKDPAQTRDRARLAFRILAIRFRDALRAGSAVGADYERAIETLLEHDRWLDLHAHVGLTVVDALLRVPS